MSRSSLRAAFAWPLACVALLSLLAWAARPASATDPAAPAHKTVPAVSLDPARPSTWNLPNPDLYGVATQGDNVWAVGYWGAVLHSSDGGATWTRESTPTDHTLYDVDFSDAQHGWAVGDRGVILHTEDGGQTWTRQIVTAQEDPTSPPRPVDFNLLGVCALSPSDVWIVGDFGTVLHTDDGVHWTQVFLTGKEFADDNTLERVLNAVHFNDANHGWIVGEFGTTLRTSDGGKTWVGTRTLVDTPSDLYLFSISPRDTSQAAVTGLAGSVLATTDGGATWQPKPTPTHVALYGVSWNPPGGVVVGDLGQLLVTQDGGQTWIEAKHPRFFNWLAAVNHAGGSRFFAVGERGRILRSDDGGQSWTQVAGAPLPHLGGVSAPEAKAPARATPAR